MKKSIVLARFDDYCTKEYMDRVLATTTHKMSLNVEDELQDRPIYRQMRKVHEAMYVAAMAMASKVKFVECDYLPHNELYKQVMVISKCFIKKNTVLYDVGGHHFPFSKELIIAGVNDFSLLYSGKSNKKEVPHLLLGPISFVNHSCYPNSIFNANADGKVYVKTIKDIVTGDEITVEYSDDYFGNSNCKCLCKLCCIVNDVVEELIKTSIAYSDCVNVNDAGVGHDDEGAAQLNTEQNVKKLHGVKTFLPGKKMPPAYAVEKNMKTLDDMGFHSSSSSSATDDDDDDEVDAAQLNTKQDSFHSSSSSSTTDDDDQNPIAVEARPNNQNIKKQILCTYCPKSFKYKSHWLRHKATHIQAQAKWKCDSCLKCFTREDSMMRHREIHEKREVYPCPRCKNTYYYFDSLKQHQKQKHSNNPNVEFKCRVCNKSFLSEKTLTYHLNIHASITPYECPICKEKFSQLYQKSRHVKKMVINKT